MPSKFPRAGRILSEDTATDRDDDAPSRSQFFWEASKAETIPGVTRLATTLIRGPMPSFAGTLAEGTNPPRDPTTHRDPTKRSTTRDETAPLD